MDEMANLDPNMTREEEAETIGQFVADACRGVVLAKSSERRERLTHDDGRPVKFDQGFAEALGLVMADGDPPASSAEVVLAVWSVEDADDGTVSVNTTALQGFGMRLLEFMQDTTRPVLGELAGKSLAAPK